MKNFKIIYSLFFALVIIGQIYGQQNSTVHIDKSYYVGGEVMWYNAYLPQSFNSADATFKVVVSDNNGDKADSYFVNNSGSSISGYYQFPFSLNTGVYHFSFSALDQVTATEVSIADFSVPFFNDLNGMEMEVSEMEEVKAKVTSDNGINIRTNKSSYSPGENVQIGIKTGGADLAEYSISIIDETLVGSTSIDIYTSDLNTVIAQPANLSKGIYTKGIVKDGKGNPKKINQLGVYDAKTKTMHLARANTQGEFTLVQPALYGKRNIQFAGYISTEANEIDVTLTNDKKVVTPQEISLSSSVANYLKESKNRKKVYQYFGSLEYDLAFDRISEEITKIKADQTYDMSKYVKFKTVGQFFNEIISSALKFEVEDGQVKALMFDAEGFKEFNRLGNVENFIVDPVFIVDGKLTKNAEFIYKMDLEAVKTIELYNSRKRLAEFIGNFRNYGIITITTSLPDINLPQADQKNVRTFEGIQPKTSFDRMKSLAAEMPQFRPLVYWNSNVTDGAGIKAPLVIKSSDDVSTFRITVVGRTKDGRVVNGSSTYKTSLSKI